MHMSRKETVPDRLPPRGTKSTVNPARRSVDSHLDIRCNTMTLVPNGHRDL